jgi:hypothetical protein
MMTRRRMLMVPPTAALAAAVPSGGRDGRASLPAPLQPLAEPLPSPAHRGPWFRGP